MTIYLILKSAVLAVIFTDAEFVGQSIIVTSLFHQKARIVFPMLLNITLAYVVLILHRSVKSCG